MKLKTVLYEADILNRSIKRIAHEILEKTDDLNRLCLVGIKTRGVPFAKRLAKVIYEIEGIKVPVGILDITLYRDDLKEDKSSDPIISGTNIDFDIEGKDIILTDDVICTGRTVRAAMDALIKMGRPSKIRLAALVDRGHRELPIRADFVGKNIPTSKSEAVRVYLEETDGKESIELYEK